MTLQDFDEVMDMLMSNYTLKPAIKFWLIDATYKHFFELNGLTPYEQRLKEIEEDAHTKLNAT